MAGPFLTSLIGGISEGFFGAERESALEKKRQKLADEERFEEALGAVGDNPEGFDPAFVDLVNKAKFNDKDAIRDIKKAISLGVVTIPGVENIPVDPGAAQPGQEAGIEPTATNEEGRLIPNRLPTELEGEPQIAAQQPAPQQPQAPLPRETAAGEPAFAPLEVSTLEERPVTIPFEEQEARRFDRALDQAKQTATAQEEIKEEFAIRAERRGEFIVDAKNGTIRRATPEEAEAGSGINQAVALSESRRIVNKQVKDTEKIKNFKFLTKELVRTQNLTEQQAVSKLLDREVPPDIRYQFDNESGVLLGIKDGKVFKLATLPRKIAVNKISSNQLEGADTWLKARMENYDGFDEPTKARMRAFFLRSMEVEGEPLAVETEVPTTFLKSWTLGQWLGSTEKQVKLVSPTTGTVADPEGSGEIPSFSVESSPLFIGEGFGGPPVIQQVGGPQDQRIIQMDAQGNVIQ